MSVTPNKNMGDWDFEKSAPVKQAVEELGLTVDPVDLAEDVDWKQFADPKSYYPTRLEYFAGKALQGMVAGRSLRDLPKIPAQAVDLAVQLCDACDQAQD